MLVPIANVPIAPIPEKYGMLPVAIDDQLLPVPPHWVPTAVPAHSPIPIVPKVVMLVVPVSASKAMFPNPRDVLPVAATKSVEVPLHLRRSV